ncbi:hypothetical protein RCL1_008370 [Eukaryota sp. TZLM3-RCL]
MTDAEPKLKYQRLSESVTTIFSQDQCTCLSAHDKFLALGTRKGAIYTTDMVGNATSFDGQNVTSVNELPPPFLQHEGGVNMVSISSNGEFVASCGEDCRVNIRSLHSPERLSFTYKGPLYALALDPGFGHGTNRNFVTGGAAGQLIYNSKGFFKAKDTVLHSGQGPITSIVWNNDLIAWSNDIGVKIIDITSNQRLTHLDKPLSGPPSDTFKTILCWVDDRLIISWGRTIRVVKINQKSHDSATRTVELISSINTEYFICGIAPFFDPDFSKPLFSMLAYFEPGEPPELIISSLETGQEISVDALEVVGFESYIPRDFSLIPSIITSSLATSSITSSEDYSEHLVFVVSPRDIIVGRPRDVEDHINYLLDISNMDEALSLAVEHYSSLRVLTPPHVAGLYSWQYLTSQATKAGGESILIVAQNVPTFDPKLPSTVYEDCLRSLADSSINTSSVSFLTVAINLCQSWSNDLFSIGSIKSHVAKLLQSCRNPELIDSLKRLLASLHIKDGQLEKAILLLIQLKDSKAFSLIQSNHVIKNDYILNHISDLFLIDSDKTINLLVSAAKTNIVPVSQVVGRLESNDLALFRFLHSLFETDGGIALAKDYHAIQLELYAKHDPTFLSSFLKQSSYYPLNKALEVCESFKLYKELVYVLGRMGSTKQALQLIITQLADITYATEFILEHNEDELWEYLIDCVLEMNPIKQNLIKDLLSMVGLHVNPSRLIHKLPNDLVMDNLPILLSKIFNDFRTQVNLAQGCSHLVSSDAVSLSRLLVQNSKIGVLVSEKHFCSQCKQPVVIPGGLTRVGTNGIVVFFCGHVVHSNCIVSDTLREKKRLCCPSC